MQQQQTQIDEAIVEAQHEMLMKQAEELKVGLKKFDNILQPIIDQCTKDSISTGKMPIYKRQYPILHVS